MEPIRYRTVFDVLAPDYRPWLLPTVGCAALVIAVLVISIFLRKQNRRISAQSLMIINLCAALLILNASVILSATVYNFARACSALKSGSALNVEGPVTHFRPMPPRPKGDESFVVNGIPFSYSDAEVTAGFHQTTRSAGPIREGLPVHIWYMDAGPLGGNEILKLEVAEK